MINQCEEVSGCFQSINVPIQKWWSMSLPSSKIWDFKRAVKSVSRVHQHFLWLPRFVEIVSLRPLFVFLLWYLWHIGLIRRYSVWSYEFLQQGHLYYKQKVWEDKRQDMRSFQYTQPSCDYSCSRAQAERIAEGVWYISDKVSRSEHHRLVFFWSSLSLSLFCKSIAISLHKSQHSKAQVHITCD
jgi:hypothetical protein